MTKSLTEFFRDFPNLKEEREVETLCIDVPTFIRILELAREDLKTDEQIHYLTTELAKVEGTIDMDAYTDIVEKLDLDDTE